MNEPTENLVIALKNLQKEQDNAHIRNTLLPCLEKDFASIPKDVNNYADKIKRQLANLEIHRLPPEHKPWPLEAKLQIFLQAYEDLATSLNKNTPTPHPQ